MSAARYTSGELHDAYDAAMTDHMKKKTPNK